MSGGRQPAAGQRAGGANPSGTTFRARTGSLQVGLGAQDDWGDGWTPDDTPECCSTTAQATNPTCLEVTRAPVTATSPTVELPPLEVVRVDSTMDRDGTRMTPLLEDPGQV
jgi:hypothetical protein